MSRRSKQTGSQNQQTGGQPITGPVTIQLGKRGLSVSGQGIQPMTIPLRARQQNANQPFQGNQQGGQGINLQTVLSNAILAATTQGQITAQMVTLHQQALAANQSLLNALQQVGQAYGTTGKSKKGFRAPQVQYNQQQQSRKQKRQQQQPQMVFAG